MREETAMRVKYHDEERPILTDADRGTPVVETRAENELCLDEHESAQLALAVQRLVRKLGFPLQDVLRSYDDSFHYFISKSQEYNGRSYTDRHGDEHFHTVITMPVKGREKRSPNEFITI